MKKAYIYLSNYFQNLSKLDFETKHTVLAAISQAVLAGVSIAVALYIFLCQIRLQERQQDIQDEQFKQQRWEEERRRAIEEVSAEFALSKNDMKN